MYGEVDAQRMNPVNPVSTTRAGLGTGSDKPRDTPETVVAIKRLEQNIVQLDKSLAVLADRLSPILRPSDQPSGGASPSEFSTSLASKIDGEAGNVANLINRVDELLRRLVEIVRTETRQRQALEKRLAGRKRPAREAFEEVGAPMLDERG